MNVVYVDPIQQEKKRKEKIKKNILYAVYFILFFFCAYLVIVYVNFGKKNFRADESPIKIADEKTVSVRVGSTSIQAYLANNEGKRAIGLSNRKRIDQNEGMLFVFDTPDYYGIWMKNMFFSIDILWLDKYGFVTNKEENVSPESYPKSFYPTHESLYVLELPSGSASRYGINIGDAVVFDQNSVK